MDCKHRVQLDIDVYEAAKQRIKHLLDVFDNLVVCFSGGKDSLTALNLTQEVYDELGIKEKVKVIFRDEEVIPDSVVDFVQGIYESGKFDFRYYAIPLISNKFVLGKTEKYVQWDRNRRWLRQPPPYAITVSGDEYREFDQYSADGFIYKDIKGRVALVNGIRADESLVRLQACVNKRNENYINATKVDRIKICKPIYDWTEDDVFLYFYKKNIKYCEIYDAQTSNNDALRVSTPLHSESAKNFSKLKTLYPTYYQQLVDLFPEMILQDKYWKEYKANSSSSVTDKYEHSFRGIYRYIDDNLTGLMRENAIKRVRSCENHRKLNPLGDNFAGYPVLYVFNQVVNGAFKRNIMPKNKPNAAEIAYETFNVGAANETGTN